MMSAGRTSDELTLPALSLTKTSSTSAQPPLALSEERVRLQNGRQLGYALSSMHTEVPQCWLGDLIDAEEISVVLGIMLMAACWKFWGMSSPQACCRSGKCDVVCHSARCLSSTLAAHIPFSLEVSRRGASAVGTSS